LGVLQITTEGAALQSPSRSQRGTLSAVGGAQVRPPLDAHLGARLVCARYGCASKTNLWRAEPGNRGRGLRRRPQASANAASSVVFVTADRLLPWASLSRLCAVHTSEKFRAHFLEATHQKLTKAARLLDLPEHRFGQLLSPRLLLHSR